MNPRNHGLGEPELSIGIARTIAISPKREEIDLLSTPSQLRRWLDAESERLPPEGPETGARLGAFRDLRDAVREVFAAAVVGASLPTQPVEVLNETSGAAPIHPVLEPDGSVRRELSRADATAAILATIARSAIEVVGQRDRLRVCPGPRCRWFFLVRRPGQIWCSAACGNRARVARHHARARSRPSGRHA